jgi:hypothetical protein
VTDSLGWMYWCRGLTQERWREECRLVEERFSLFRSFAEPPFLGFRGVVARAGCEYQVTVAAEVDFIQSTCLGHLLLPPLWALVRMGRCLSTSLGIGKHRGLWM